MPHFMIKGRYTTEGMKGLHKDKGSGREKVLSGACKAVGGKLVNMWYALGDSDVYAVVDMPGHLQVTSLCTAIAAAGVASTETVTLLTVAEMDKALAETVKYKAAG
jgi:uncharacterized protein with GYD domain